MILLTYDIIGQWYHIQYDMISLFDIIHDIMPKSMISLSGINEYHGLMILKCGHCIEFAHHMILKSIWYHSLDQSIVSDNLNLKIGHGMILAMIS